MSWAEVYKINDDFTTPLNKLILGNCKLVANDSQVIAQLVNKSISATESTTYSLGTFTPKIDGVVRFKTKIKNSSSLGSFNGKIYIKLDNVVVGTASFVVNKNTTDEVNIDVSVTKDSTYTLSFSTTGTASGRVIQDVCGGIIDKAFYNYTEGE